MSTGEITVTLFNGRRELFDPQTKVLVRAIDGRHKHMPLVEKQATSFRFTDLKVRDNSADDYTILVATKGHTDAGFVPVRIRANERTDLELMLLRRDGTFEFDSFDQIVQREALHNLLCGERPDEARSLYEDLKNNAKPALACLLNITTALEQLSLVPGRDLTPPAPDLDANPLASFKALDRPPQPDRMFAWVDARLVAQVQATAAQNGKNAFSRITKAPAGLHEGATISFKQTDFGEGNVQLSFHDKTPRTIDGVDCILVDADIDYFKDTLAHLLLEVFPNKLKKKVHGKESAEALTDPRTVYGLRWMAGRRLGREFRPPYVLS